MHKYDHHIGDYDRDTNYLNLLEHGVYRRLLDWAYADERPLPDNLERVCKRLGARTKTEKNAVKFVLSEFFKKIPEGMIHKRVDKEIAASQERVIQSQWGLVKRYWKKVSDNDIPTLDEYRANPDHYRDPITGQVRDNLPTTRGLLAPSDPPTTNQPPTANRQPPTASTNINTPIIPKGDEDETGGLELEGGSDSATNQAPLYDDLFVRLIKLFWIPKEKNKSPRRQSAKRVARWRKLKQQVGLEDVELLEWFYGLEKSKDCDLTWKRKVDVDTLMNNYTEQVELAERHRASLEDEQGDDMAGYVE